MLLTRKTTTYSAVSTKAPGTLRHIFSQQLILLDLDINHTGSTKSHTEAHRSSRQKSAAAIPHISKSQFSLL